MSFVSQLDKYGITQAWLESIYRVKLNQIRMLKMRGYNVDHEEDLLTYDFEQFMSYLEENEAALIDASYDFRRAYLNSYYCNSQDNKIEVYYAADNGTDAIVTMGHEIGDANNIILIAPKALTSTATTTIKSLAQKVVEVFIENELQYNIFDHMLNPEFHVLSEHEIKSEIYRKVTNNDGKDVYIPRYKRADLMRILVTDIVARWLGLKPGKILRITRSIKFQESLIKKEVRYRLCVTMPAKKSTGKKPK